MCGSVKNGMAQTVARNTQNRKSTVYAYPSTSCFTWRYVNYYLTSIGSVASGSPSELTVSVAVPGCSPSTITTSLPLNNGIRCELNVTSDVASPLHTARNEPAPLTSKAISLSAVGHGLPSLSTRLTVTNDRSRPFDDIVCLSALSTIRAGSPAVFTVRVSAALPLASYATTVMLPGWYTTSFQRRR